MLRTANTNSQLAFKLRPSIMSFLCFWTLSAFPLAPAGRASWTTSCSVLLILFVSVCWNMIYQAWLLGTFGRRERKPSEVLSHLGYKWINWTLNVYIYFSIICRVFLSFSILIFIKYLFNLPQMLPHIISWIDGIFADSCSQESVPRG